MTKVRPVMMTWSGEVMTPDPRFMPLCNKQFAVGEKYPLLPVEERSMASHNQFFAACEEGWQNLPENIAIRWPTSEHLRKWCLVETGFFDEREFESETPKKAKELAVFIRKVDTYGVIHVHGCKVIVRDAKSQSLAAMGKDTFQKSKQAVLDLIDSMIGVERGTIQREAGQSA